MTPQKYERVAALFLAARERAADDQAAYVGEVCGEDAELRDAVLSLLRRDAETQHGLDTPIGSAGRRISEALLSSQQTEIRPERIGSYRILETLGEGGFGVVYLAEQDSPRRTVALKVLRAAMASAEVVRRFEYESQILGRLRHPGIAQVFEAGIAGHGHARLPYIAMEHIRGSNLLAFGSQLANESAVHPRNVLNLFTKVCAGVEHAHRSGVIHRDLKPANILVDEHGQPKILDFGVARAVDGGGDLTRQTQSGQIVGTLAYMSPEQVTGDGVLDTRTDVYSLGVILYQLLAHRLPLDISQRSLHDALRIIREEAPPALGSIDRKLGGDLQAIAARALQKDPEARYPSVALFREDIEAYLAGRTVRARPLSAVYQIRMFARRHRRLVIASTLIFASLVAGTIGTTWQAIRASSAAQLAQVEARKAARVNQFLQSILVSADPNRSRGREVSVRELLDKSAERVHDELSGEPEVEAAVRATIGDTYANLGAYDRAETHLRAALSLRREVLGENHADVLMTILSLARVLRDQERSAEALELVEPAIKRYEQQKDRDEATLGRALMLRGDILRYSSTGYSEVEKSYRDAMDIFTRLYGPRCAQVANLLGNLGGMQYDLFRLDDAEASLGQAFAIARELHGPDFSTTIMNANNFATVLTARGRIDRAAEIAEPALQSALRIFGAEHPETARLLVMVADLCLERCEPDRAEPLARQALAVRQQTLPAGHRLINWSRVLLADVLAARGDYQAAAEAEALACEAIQMHEEQGAGAFWACAEARSVLGAALAAQGRVEEAEALQCAAIEVIKLGQGARSRPCRNAIRRLIQTFDRAEMPEMANEYRTLLASVPPR